MLKRVGVIPMFTLLSILLGCSADRGWQNDFRFGLNPNEPSVRHKLIPQYFDSVNEQGEQFYLYYFTRGPKRQEQPEKPVKTILFCAGGPGQVFWSSQVDLFLADLETDYRVVYFHLRGAGFSQFPESNSYDRYLRTKYAVRDIEKIFLDLQKDDPRFKKWDAVVGFSYGTVLAQQYTAKNPGSVAKLVLASAGSKHPFKKPIEDPARKKFVSDLASGYGTLLEDILRFDGGLATQTFGKQFPKFFDLVERPDYNKDQAINDITTQLTEIFSIQDSALLSADPLIDFYDELKKLDAQVKQSKNQVSDLQKLMRYDRQFFIDLKEFRNDGWGEAAEPGASNDKEIAARALRISAQLLMLGRKKINVEERFKEIVHIPTTDLCISIVDAKSQLSEQIRDDAKAYGIWCDNNKCVCRARETTGNNRFAGSRRVFYNMAIYDGLDAGFLDTWAHNSRTAIPDLIKEEQWWQRDPFIRNIGFVWNEEPHVWDPGEAQCRHSVPTLLLRGKADPVTAGQQTDYIFDAALLGPRYLVEFDGVGHALNVPKIEQARLPKGAKTSDCGINPTKTIQTRSCIVESFIADKFETIEDVLVLYQDRYALSSEHRTWISDNPVRCDVVKKAVDTIASDREKAGTSASPICKVRSNPS